MPILLEAVLTAPAKTTGPLPTVASCRQSRRPQAARMAAQPGVTPDDRMDEPDVGTDCPLRVPGTAYAPLVMCYIGHRLDPADVVQVWRNFLRACLWLTMCTRAHGLGAGTTWPSGLSVKHILAAFIAHSVQRGPDIGKRLAQSGSALQHHGWRFRTTLLRSSEHTWSSDTYGTMTHGRH